MYEKTRVNPLFSYSYMYLFRLSDPSVTTDLVTET